MRSRVILPLKNEILFSRGTVRSHRAGLGQLFTLVMGLSWDNMSSFGQHALRWMLETINRAQRRQTKE